MHIILGIVRYLFVATTLVGGAVVLGAIVRLALEKRHPEHTGTQS